MNHVEFWQTYCAHNEERDRCKADEYAIRSVAHTVDGIAAAVLLNAKGAALHAAAAAACGAASLEARVRVRAWAELRRREVLCRWEDDGGTA